MNLRNRAAGWALLTMSTVLMSCEFIPPVSNRHRIYRPREHDGSYRHLPYHLEAEVTSPIRGGGVFVRVNRAVALFDLSAYADLLKNEGTAVVEGTQGDSTLVETLGQGEVITLESESELATTEGHGDLVSREETDEIMSAEGTSRIDEREQESSIDTTRQQGEAIGVASTVRFASLSALEDYVKNRAAYLRVRNAAIANLVEQDHVLQMVFQYSKAEFTKLVQEATIRRADLLQFTKSISVDEIVPGETFEYTLQVHNTAPATITKVTLYDEFPTSLHYERNFRVTLTRADGTEETFNEETHPRFFQSVVTDDEFEAGKICWALDRELHHKDTLRLSFDATYFNSKGAPSEAGVPLYASATASSDEVVTRLEEGDRVYMIEPSEDNEDFLRVFVRRPIEDGVGARRVVDRLEKFEGFLLASQYRRDVDEDATDQELRMKKMTEGTTSDDL